MDNRLYDEFSATTEHFYDELGKLSECEAFFKRKDYKVIRKKIINLFFDALDTLFKKENVNNKVERNELKKDHEAYKAENSRKAKRKGVTMADISLIEPPSAVGQLTSSKIVQLPPSPDETQTKSAVIEGENTKQETEEKSQEEQNERV